MSSRELLFKLGGVVFLVAFCILLFAMIGFWLDYYKLHTVPIFTVLGAVGGTVLAFFGTLRIIVYGHNTERREER